MGDLIIDTMSTEIENINTEKHADNENSSLPHNRIICPTILTGMSHEVRTHMNAIVAFSFLMSKDNCDESERQEFSSQILSSCEQLIGLFDNFIDSAIIETGNSKADLKVCKLNNILDDLLSEFREVLSKGSNKEVILISENSSSDNIEVFIDSNRVFRVIRNLFQNAVKNTNSGYIKVGYYFRDDNVTFYVIDSGQGYFKCKEFLQTEDMNVSLTRYYDTYSAVNIALAKNLIQMLNGSVWIECNGLTGSAIYFSIPVKIAQGSLDINKFLNSMIAI
jgi:K+-sensing histidine kinase KdpD